MFKTKQMFNIFFNDWEKKKFRLFVDLLKLVLVRSYEFKNGITLLIITETDRAEGSYN